MTTKKVELTVQIFFFSLTFMMKFNFTNFNPDILSYFFKIFARGAKIDIQKKNIHQSQLS